MTGKPAFARNLKAKTQAEDAADSVCRNIAEGFGCETHREFARFLEISRRSLNELHDALRSSELKGYCQRPADCVPARMTVPKALSTPLIAPLSTSRTYANRDRTTRSRDRTRERAIAPTGEAEIAPTREVEIAPTREAEIAPTSEAAIAPTSEVASHRPALVRSHRQATARSHRLMRHRRRARRSGPALSSRTQHEDHGGRDERRDGCDPEQLLRRPLLRRAAPRRGRARRSRRCGRRQVPRPRRWSEGRWDRTSPTAR